MGPWRGADAWKARVGGRALQHVLDAAWLRASNWRAGRRSSREDMVVRCSIGLGLLLELPRRPEVSPRESARAQAQAQAQAHLGPAGT